jgi:hypothetical protein
MQSTLSQPILIRFTLLLLSHLCLDLMNSLFPYGFRPHFYISHAPFICVENITHHIFVKYSSFLNSQYLDPEGLFQVSLLI